MKKRNTFAVVLALLLVATMLLPGCSNKPAASGNTGTQQTKGDLTIAFAGPLTGSCAQDGESGYRGVQIAVDQINAAGGINGQKVVVTKLDDKGDPKEAATVASKLAQDKNVLGIVGHYNSSCTLAGAEIYNSAKVTAIAFGSSAAAVTDAGPYVFRTIPTDDIGGRYAAKWAFQKYSAKTAAIIYENSDYGVGAADIYKQECDASGVKIVANESYNKGETSDFTTLLTKIKTANPDVILVGGLYNEMAMIAKQGDSMGYKPHYIGVDGIYSPALIQMGGGAVEGVTFSAFFSDASKEQKVVDFVAAYKKAYNEAPGTYAAYAYDGASIILQAIKEAGADRVKINEYITKLSSFAGVTGDNGFDKNGDVTGKNPSMITVSNGAFTVIQ